MMTINTFLQPSLLERLARNPSLPLDHVEFFRRITRQGIRLFGIYYQCHRLQVLRRAIGNKRVIVWADLNNIGEILVWGPDATILVPPTQPYLDGVTLADWLRVARSLRHKDFESLPTGHELIRQFFRGPSVLPTSRTSRPNSDKELRTLDQKLSASFHSDPKDH